MARQRAVRLALSSIHCAYNDFVAPTWEEVKQEFEEHDLVRDVYVRNAGIEGWQRFLDALRTSDYNYSYTVDLQPSSLPEKAETAFDDATNVGTELLVSRGGVVFPCHFFNSEHFESTVYPEAITDPASLQILCDWMRFLAQSTGLSAVLTPENFPDTVILSMSPDGVFQHRPPMPRKWYWPFGR